MHDNAETYYFSPRHLATTWLYALSRIPDSFYVADYLTGEISTFSRDGTLRNRLAGFAGPMGLTRSPIGEICVAEKDAGKVTCIPEELLQPSD